MDRMYSTNEDEVAAKFFSACNHGDVDTIKHLLKHEPYAKRLIELTNSEEPNAKKIAEKTIYTATLRGHYSAAKVLLEAGANARVNTGYGTPIYAAVKSGSLDLVRLLIEYRADFQSGKGFSPLFVACIEGRLNILKYLVDLGANLYAFTNPPLVFTACTAGQLEVLKFLMEEMEFNIRHTMSGQDYSRAEGDGKDTLLWCACKSNKLEVASYLVKRGAPITRTIFAKFPVIIKHILQQKIRPVGKPPAGGEAEQHYHARFKEIGLAEMPWGVLADYSKRLTKLELRANSLTSLPDKIFQMPALKVLDVSNNALPEICQEEVEWKCLQLMDFDGSHNQLSYVPSGLFKMPELANLSLSYNLLGHLPGDPEDASAQTTSGLPNDVDWRCDKLKKLDLSHNRLRALPDTFQDLRRMVALNVSYNHLKEIPQSCSWGCVNLVHLDASHNNLSDLPIGATSYWTQSLERLFLSHNSIIDVSQNITELSHLTTLDLSHNKIRSLPPTSFWSGNRLNKLNLSFNQLNMLTHLPESKAAASRGTTPVETPTGGGTKLSVIKKLGNKVTAKKTAKPPERIKEEGDDQPKELPFDLWSNCLQSLYLQSNQLRWLPDYLGKFAALTRLDISGNSEVHELPLTLGRLRNCWELNLNGLRIQNVPHHLLPGVSKGGSTKHLLAYLRAQLRHCVPYNRMKLMAVGLQGRGKTTLLSVLRNPSSPLPPNVSTVGVVMAEWVVPPPAYVVKAKKGQVPARHNIEIEFSVWDMAGQEVYYATHQCFLSRNTLYLVVWNMEEKEKGIDYLRPWLLNIQARAPYSPVIIVGTHLDKVPLQKTHEMKEFYKKKIRDLYDKPGYPRISAIMCVSCTSMEGIRELQERIHNAAIKAVDPDTKEHVIGQLVPSSYVALQQKVAEEVMRCREKEVPPVLNQKEFAALAESIEDGDINDPEELSLAAQFLHDNGILLHYNDHLRGLNNLYFIDPVWLADMLAEVVTVPEKNSFVHNGILKESNVAFIFRDNRRFPSTFFQQYLQLLERFEIALSLGNGNRLIPSMLPYQRPVLNFVDPEPTPRKSSSHDEELYIPKRELRVGSVGHSDTESVSSLPAFAPEGSEKGPRMVDGMEVVDYPVNCIRRRYNMAYVPSGFWSRLISRLIINLKRSGLVEDHSAATQGSPIIYWKRGIVVLHSTGRFLVESINKQAEMSGVGIGGVMLEASARFMGSIEDRSVGLQGVDIMVWSSCGDFSAMGYVVDQLDSLIDEWFPGLNEYDVEGQWLVQRQVLWKIPKYILDKVQGKASRRDSQQKKQRREAWSLVAEDGEEMGEIVIYPLEKCAAEALIGDTIECTEYSLRIPLSYLVPDLLLTDLPPHLTVELSQFQFNPQDPATRLGRGGAGAVYKGRYRGNVVAVKEFLTASQAEHTGETVGAHGGYEEDDLITQADAMFLFRDLRQEVTVLAQLSHPNIVALLGVSIRPMCMVIEFAPMGSLFGTLDKTVEQIKQDQADRASVILRMPGGVLGREITMKIALQVALAIRYLHRHSIVYRDLKSDNVLIWSLDSGEPVNAKLADYGISRFANPGGVKGEEGTPGYLAPEAIRRRGEDQAFDEKVDIFSYAMFIFELLTGQRPYESLTTTQELNQAVIKGERPLVNEGNAEPSFPGLMDLMYDCWKHSSSDRPDADEIVQRICEPGFLCRSHTIRRSRDQPLQKIDTIYARPILADDLESGRKSYTLWTWARQDQERNFSIIDVRKGVFNLPEKQAPGGRVYAMTATGEVEKRIWIGTADHEIQVYGYKSVGDPQCLWTFTTKDSVLALTTELEGGRVKRVFASLANGTLCIFSRRSISSLEPGPVGDANCIAEACTIKCSDEQFRAEAEDWSNPLIMRLGEGQRAAKCMTFVGQDQLWCGCGNTITVVDSNELKVLHHIPVFVRKMALVNELVSAGDRVWGVGRQLSCVMEWDAKTFQLLHIFNANNIDPTNENVITDPKTVEELVDRDRHNSPKAPDTPTDKQLLSQESFKVENEPIRLQASSAPFSQRTTRRTLREIKPRERSKNIKFQQGGPRSRIYTTRDLVRRRQQGSTRTTSLVIVDHTLWVARGMGDVLVIDITRTKSHGKVLARLATEDCEKFGNRSYHKLVQVAGEYVVSSQWLEPVDIRREGRGQGAFGGGGGGGGDPFAVAHQSITIWEAWNHRKIEQFMTRRASMLMLEEDEGSAA